MIAANDAPSRRAIFGLVAGISAAAITGPIAASAPPTGASAWDAAMRKMVRAKAAYEADNRSFDQLAAARRDGLPDEAMVDWSSLPDGKQTVFPSYDLDAAESATRRQIERGIFRVDHLREAAQRRLAAYDQVRAFKAAQKANDERHGYDAAADRNSMLGEALSDCEADLVAMPAPHLAALLWKIEHLVFDDGGSISPWTFTYAEPMLRDARRLLGAGA